MIAPVPLGDGRHDIGDAMRDALVRRLMDDWSREPDLTPARVQHLAMWAAASVRAVIHEIGILDDAVAPSPPCATCATLTAERERLLAGSAVLSESLDAAITQRDGAEADRVAALALLASVWESRREVTTLPNGITVQLTHAQWAKIDALLAKERP